MKVSIIDNSLCDSSFVSDVKPEAIKAYTDALHEFGVSYIEMTTDSFIMIPPASDMSKIILRMTSVRDLLYINSFDFAYVVVPAQLTDLIPKIERPVISELCLHGSDYMRVTDMFEKNFELDKVSMIRFVDDFRKSPQEMARMLAEYRPRRIAICAAHPPRVGAIRSAEFPSVPRVQDDRTRGIAAKIYANDKLIFHRFAPHIYLLNEAM